VSVNVYVRSHELKGRKEDFENTARCNSREMTLQNTRCQAILTPERSREKHVT
jgi:hypothetical protein